MIRKHLQVGEDGHEEARVVLIVRDDHNQGLQGFLLLCKGPLSKRFAELARLWSLRHGVIVDDEVAVPAGLFFSWHLFSFL